MFKQLLWKEWRENLWKLTFGGAVSAACVLLLFRIRLFPDSANCVAISFVQMLVLPVLYALDIFSGEMSNRTIHLLFNFPVPRWKMFFAKYFISVGGITTVFLLTSFLVELFSQGREADPGKLFLINSSAGLVAILLFTWFCAFGAQSRSEAGSLAAMFGVMIGGGIILFWAEICKVPFGYYITPFAVLKWTWGYYHEWLNPVNVIMMQVIAFCTPLCIAYYRFIKVRRWL